MPNNTFNSIPSKINAIGTRIVDSAIKVHKALGPGLLESVYEECMAYELGRRNLSVERQMSVPIQYDSNTLKTPLQLDLLIHKSVIVELKSVEKMNPIFESQLMTYLRLSGLRLGYLINFNVPLVKNGIKRMVM
ncbi:MAG: GxxExxY protein [Candidatus Marinimicrobia bacterium]|jgi:GxxExxY protein|nr:GxxExxY protein [Candidatus Neomarinimicrobiota bacterium]MBT3849252.1 GxxExxY protein [Candidatus Neomarinimicrobiota bacterium]MBT4054925.1 GxxExxY protein [Candidatus Neomarinimicrobiota bacterium]MBT4370210.1 GxxExxY protein [Candidatus Neomarinimicrobiota bacterium]MBT4663145.1 GxxExxY protein [Candidatus Neomarinimicrobiota bacterium]